MDEEEFEVNPTEEYIAAIDGCMNATINSATEAVNKIVDYLLHKNKKLVINTIWDFSLFNKFLWTSFNYGEEEFPETGRFVWANSRGRYGFIVFENLIICIDVDLEKRTTEISRLPYGLQSSLEWCLLGIIDL